MWESQSNRLGEGWFLRAAVSDWNRDQNHPENLLKQMAGPLPRVSDLVGLGFTQNVHFYQVPR